MRTYKNALLDSGLTGNAFRGTDTVAIFLEWILARMVLHPDIQAKVQFQLDTMVGTNRTVTDSDLPKLPYLLAIVKEILRHRRHNPKISSNCNQLTTSSEKGIILKCVIPKFSSKFHFSGPENHRTGSACITQATIVKAVDTDSYTMQWDFDYSKKNSSVFSNQGCMYQNMDYFIGVDLLIHTLYFVQELDKLLQYDLTHIFHNLAA
ncbi:uncharacterized protein LOC111382743 [Olea europaea var. sylvestris]|uniref:uncharacterized protein LOC111382743 n=1 Tax=Olea europaea var. sylvestris TaxID=158386 RepID=UPI000C1D8CAD|nr:uncharacterized protein LOC111382743 [Olea europaea var. sylvestris]